MPDWNDLGRRLSGLGAGLSGTGGQWRRDQETMRQNRLAQLDSSLIQNMTLAGSALEAGDTQAASMHLMSLAKAGRELGGDTSMVMNLMQRLQTDPQGVCRDINALLGAYGSGPMSNRGKTAAIQNYEYFIDIVKDPNASDAAKQAALYQLSAAGRPQGERVMDINGNLVTVAPGQEAEQVFGPGGAFTPERAGIDRGTIAEGEEAGKDRQGLRQARIDLGVGAAQGIPTARRALDLLKRVETGGIDALDIRVKQSLGLENADEGELANILGKAVLSQLKATFGAQFTEREGALLQRIEAGIGKSNAANRRILENLIKRAESRSQAAIDAAAAMGDYQTAADIKREMEFEYGEEDDFSWLGGPPPLPQGFEIDE